jgi:hypothetical protein
MDARSVGVIQYEDILRFEVKRWGKIEGHDSDDLMQELRVVVAEAVLPKLDGSNTGRTYVRRSVRNALTNLQRAAKSQGRTPRDARGRTIPVDYLEHNVSPHQTLGDTIPAPGPLPDQAAETTQLIEALDTLPTGDRQLLYDAFVLGAETGMGAKDARNRARVILTNLLNPVDQRRRWPKTRTPSRGRERRRDMAKAMKGWDTPECHIDGKEPVGYETENHPEEADDCINCLDKFSCLADGIKRKLIDAKLGIDPEVKAAHHGLVTIEEMRTRIEKRTALTEKGKPIPKDLTYDNIPGVTGTKLDALADTPLGAKTQKTEEEKTMSEEETETPPPKAKAKKAKAKKAPAPKKVDGGAKPAAKKKAKPAKKDAKPKAEKKAKAPKAKASKPEKKAKAKPEKKAKAKPEKKAKAKKGKAPKAKASRNKGGAPNNRGGEKGSFKYDGKPKKLPDGRIELPNGRYIPAPKELTKEKMLLALERVNSKLALDFDLVIGMKLIQHRRGDDGPLVVALKKNGFEYEGDIYSSLTGACMAACLRSVSGAEVFNFEKHRNLEVKGKAVPGGSFHSGETE